MFSIYDTLVRRSRIVCRAAMFSTLITQKRMELKLFMTSRYKHTHRITFFEVHKKRSKNIFCILFFSFLLKVLRACINHSCKTRNYVSRVVVRNMQPLACLWHVVVATSFTDNCTNVSPYIVWRVPQYHHIYSGVPFEHTIAICGGISAC